MNQKLTTVFILVFLVTGIVLCAMGVYTVFFEKRGYVQTDAVIDHIDEIWTGVDDDGYDEYEYDVYVAYQVDGRDYLSKSDYYQDGYEPGKQIKIYYNPSDPADIHGDSAGFGIFLMVLGPVVSVGALVALLRSRRFV